MRRIFTAGAKFLVFAFAIVVFFTINQRIARADTVIINGLTFGSDGTVRVAIDTRQGCESVLHQCRTRVWQVQSSEDRLIDQTTDLLYYDQMAG